MYIIVSLIGGLLILDKYAIGIFGFSQPIVAGLIFGSLFGDLQTFIVLGAYLQLIYIAMLPIGRSIPPDGELGGITGLAIHALFPDLPLSVPLFFAIGTSVFSGYSDILFRHFNNTLYRRGISAATTKQIDQTINFHFLGLPVAFIRGFLTILLMISIVNILNPSYIIWQSAILVIPLAIGFASGLFLFFKKKYVLFLLSGVACGWILHYLAS